MKAKHGTKRKKRERKLGISHFLKNLDAHKGTYFTNASPKNIQKNSPTSCRGDISYFYVSLKKLATKEHLISCKIAEKDKSKNEVLVPWPSCPKETN